MVLAKLTRPTLYGVAPRQRLFDQLDGEATAVWVQGSAGAGKTTLLASYLDARRIPALWYDLDERDAEPVRLLDGLATVGATLAGVAARGRGPSSDRAASLGEAVDALDALFAALPDGTRVVLDNVHALAPDAPTHEVLVAALRRTSGRVRFVLASRDDPAPPWELLLDEGALRWVRPDAMRARAGEVGQLARARGLLGVSEERLADVDGCAQGWMAGLVLLLDAVRHGHSPSGRFESAEHLFSVAAAAWLERIAPGERRLLVELAALPCVTARLARAVASHEPAQSHTSDVALLERFAEAGLLTTRDRDLAGVFRLHPLLRDFLRDRAVSCLDDPEREALEERVAEALDA